MARPVRKPANQKLARGRKTASAIRNTKLSTKNPGSKPAKRLTGRLTDSRRFD